MDMRLQKGSKARVCTGMVLMRIIHCLAQGHFNGADARQRDGALREKTILNTTLCEEQAAWIVPQFSPDFLLLIPSD